MADRRERVILTLDDEFTPGMVKAAAATALLNRELKSTSGSSVGASRGMSKVESEAKATSKNFDAGAKSIDKYSGRLGILVDSALAFGPALAPISAVGIGAVAGLSSELGFAAVGAGTLLLAFHGLGDVLKAVDKAALEPTAENIQAMREAMDAISPSARQFVLELHSLEPELAKLKAAAGSGLFPGLTSGIEAASAALPQVERIFTRIGNVAGDLASQAGGSLGGDQWKPFLDFIQKEAPPALAAMGHAIGNLTHGLAELWIAFAPLNTTVSLSLVRASRAFDQWASSLSKTEGFREFLNYIETEGPRVGDLLASVAKTLIDIATAAAPLGGPLLSVLTALSNVIDDIAKSNLGTPIFTLISALSLARLAIRAFGAASDTALGQFISGQRQAIASVRELAVAQKDASLSAAQFGQKQVAANQGLATLRGGALRGAAGIAGLGLAMTGAGNSVAGNTAQLALMGAAIGGPWGAAVGGAVGLLEGFTSHQDDSAAATSDFTSTLNQQTGAVTENTRALAAQALQQDGALDLANQLGLSLSQVVDAAVGSQAALTAVKGQLQQITNPQGYSASGFQVVDPEQVKAAHDLMEELGILGGTVSGDQQKQRQLAEATKGSGEAADKAKAQHHALRLELAAEKQAAATTATSFLTLGQDVNNAKVSLDKWIHQLAAQAQALENFGSNAKRAADKGLRDGLIKQLQAAGPEGALRMKQLAGATQTEIAKANRAWGSGKKAANDYQDAVAYIANHPPTVSIKGVPQSIAALRQVEVAMRAIHDRVVNITVERHGGGGKTLPGMATGGYTGPGPRLEPRGIVHAGEVVIPQSLVKRDWASLKSRYGNLPGFAGGGVVGSGTAATAHESPEHKRLRKSLDADSKALDTHKAKLSSLVQAEQQYAQSIAQSLRSDLFSQTDIWSQNAGPQATLRSDIANARGFNSALHALVGKGVHGGALAAIAQSGNLQAAQMLAGEHRGQLRQYQHLFQLRNRLTNQTGQYAANVRYGPDISTIRAEVIRLRKEVTHLRREAPHNADRTGKAAAAGTDARARRAARRKHP